MSWPTFIDESMFAVKSSHNPAALMLVSSLALAANVAVAVYEILVLVKTKKNPLKEEVFTHLPAYPEKVLEAMPK